MIRYITIAAGLFFATNGLAQTSSNEFIDVPLTSPANVEVSNKKRTISTSFGVQTRAILPIDYLTKNIYSTTSLQFESTIFQKSGFSFGGVVRTNITNTFALETGINFTQRRFDLNVAIADSNIFIAQDMTFIEYDIPINALFYIPMSEKFFLNTSVGVALSYKPTNTRVNLRHENTHYFNLYGFRNKSVGFSLNANAGLEYRTKKNGSFYLGGAIRFPFAQLFEYVAFYNSETESDIGTHSIDGSFIALDFKYLLPFKKK